MSIPSILIPSASLSVSQSVIDWDLNEVLAANLKDDGVSDFFPVQCAVIPRLIRYNARLCVRPRDILCSAPTGSGKTIAYVAPVLNSIIGIRKTSTNRQLRAVFMLPSKELATQVFNVVLKLSRDTGIRTALAVGQESFEKEQFQLIAGDLKRLRPDYDPVDTLCDGRGNWADLPYSNEVSSKVDLLVCTPGRLMDHLQRTPGFTLAYLRFLVLDEADRLLGNAYHSWVRTLVQSITETEAAVQSRQIRRETETDVKNGIGVAVSRAATTQPHKRHKLSGSAGGFSSKAELVEAEEEGTEREGAVKTIPRLGIQQPSQLIQRLLFSATLTDNPRKLALLGIRDPLVIKAAGVDTGVGVAGDDTLVQPEHALSLATSSAPPSASSGYTLPSTLSESVCVCDASTRPLMISALLFEACNGLLSGVEGVPETNNDITTDPSSTAAFGDDDVEDDNVEASSSHSMKRITPCDRNDVILIFTSSVEATHRLATLLQLVNGQEQEGGNKLGKKLDKKRRAVGTGFYGSSSNISAVVPGGGVTADSDVDLEGQRGLVFGGLVLEVSSRVTSAERATALRDAQNGCVRILVSTDNMARGIDLPNVTMVINYDPPTYAKVYVHRAGRTARAGRLGHCLTMLKQGQVGTFKKMRASIQAPIGGAKVPHKCHVSSAAEKTVRKTYEGALQRLAAAMDNGKS